MAGVSTSDDFVSEINVTPFVDVMPVHPEISPDQMYQIITSFFG